MTISVVAVDTRKEKCGHIGQENVDSVPLGRMSTAVPMALTTYLAEERPTKKRPAQHIGCGIIIESTVSQPDYWTQDCSGRSRPL